MLETGNDIMFDNGFGDVNLKMQGNNTERKVSFIKI